MKAPLVAFLRLAFSLLTLGAMGWQLAIHLGGGYSIINFFSYFTNLSNFFAALVLLFGAIQFFARKETAGPGDLLRAASVVNMSVVGIVFAVLLRNVDLGALLPWVNFVLHTLMPCVVVLDWLLQPPTAKLGRRQLLQVLVFPAVYLAYTLLRGSSTGWYPYPFLNPAHAGGYGGVAAYSIGITLTFVFAALLLFAIGNKLSKAPAAASHP
ncbi:Pr6Pr family membrane protein [Undibacterium terreum]|uniref:FAR-17a/AIG1-like protein n=1 Tax=Undibacterium terreum TaxID=1224302 RepID=A0A916UM14_9BURK|nr:Pr6Pr family membrane protein [Undibacterium terreum]GGC77045.1 hypothetical protein GCM10011396_25300 [Undibacterium terreum]